MPLTGKGEKILESMKEEYGAKKGEEVFYASKNARRISGVDSAHDAGKDFWTYKAASETPSLEDAIKVGAISSTTTEVEWNKLGPGMKREIVRTAKKRSDSSDAPMSERLDTMTQQVNSLGKAARAVAGRMDGERQYGLKVITKSQFEEMIINGWQVDFEPNREGRVEMRNEKGRREQFYIKEFMR